MMRVLAFKWGFTALRLALSSGAKAPQEPRTPWNPVPPMVRCSHLRSHRPLRLHRRSLSATKKVRVSRAF